MGSTVKKACAIKKENKNATKKWNDDKIVVQENSNASSILVIGNE